MRGARAIPVIGGFLFLLGAGQLSGCEFRTLKAPGDLSINAIDARQISFEMVQNRVFQNHCVSCHGNDGGVNLESYESVRRHLRQIERVALTDRTMPPSGALPEFEARYLAAWIQAGAAEFPGSADPDPSPSEAPLEPRFSSIRHLIFEARCMSCHRPGGEGHEVSLDSVAELLNSPRDLVEPGNSAESGLFIAITRTDSKRMPPPKSGPPLGAEEIAAIQKWIDSGAPDSR